MAGRFQLPAGAQLQAMAAVLLLACVAPRVIEAGLTPFALPCKANQYLDESVCKNCIDRKSPFTAIRPGAGGRKCYFPETSIGLTTCSMVTVNVKIRSYTDPKKTTGCIDYKQRYHTVIFPTSSTPELPGLKYQGYKKTTLRLQGLDTRKTPKGEIYYVNKTAGATKGLAVTFSDPYRTFKKRQGAAVQILGVLQDPRGSGLPLCFTAFPIVCPKNASG